MYQTRINPLRNMSRSIIYKASLCCVSSTNKMVNNLLRMCSIFAEKTKLQHVCYLLSSLTAPMLIFFSDELEQLFSCCMNFNLRSMAEILVNWCSV